LRFSYNEAAIVSVKLCSGNVDTVFLAKPTIDHCISARIPNSQ